MTCSFLGFSLTAVVIPKRAQCKRALEQSSWMSCTAFSKRLDCQYPGVLFEEWRKKGDYDQVVGHPAIVRSPHVVGKHLRASPGRRVLDFVDNDAARCSLLLRLVGILLFEFWRLEGSLQCVSWFERVLSKSNCSDALSRRQFERFRLLLHGITDREVQVVEVLDVSGDPSCYDSAGQDKNEDGDVPRIRRRNKKTNINITTCLI